MHISLDAALQRQPLLSTVGDKLLPTYPGAAAAYSLRALNGDANNVVNVRRDADDAELDFTAEGVSFELEDWVNGKLEDTLPADVDTASAAYSLRKVRDAYTGNALQVRRPSDNVEVNVAFDANNEVSASSAISNVEDIELVSESGFATDTGGFASSISGATFTFGNTLDGKDNVLFATFDGSGLLGLNFSTSDVAIGDVVTYSFDVYWASTNTGGLPNLRIRSGNTTIGHTDVPMPSEDSWYTFSGQFTVTSNTPTALTFIAADSSGLTTGDVFAIANGSYGKQQDAGDTTATTLGEFLTEATPARNRTGSARYDTLTPDGTTGFTAVTNNIAACGFDIAGTSGTAVQVSFDITLNSGTVSVKLRPDFETGSDVSNEETMTTSGSKSFTLTSTADFKAMLFITASADYVVSNFSVNVPYNHDAYVVTWYDQSVNGYHATQDTAGEQPKIAEAGSLLTDGVGFGGSQSFNLPTDIISSIDSVSSFVVAKLDDTSGTRVGLALSRNNPDKRYYNPVLVTGSFDFGYGTAVSAIAFGTADTSKHLFSATSGVSTTEAFLDGTSKGTVSSTSGLNTLASGGISEINSALYWSGTINEIIVYASDQSDNRFKIESNINNYYGIYTPAHNGFVETWYDQSGNDYHASQTSTGNQPKIVDAGSYLGELDFDGVNYRFDIVGFAPISLTYSAFVVASLDEPAVGSLKTIFDSSDSTNGGFSISHGNTAQKFTPFWFDGDDVSANVFGAGSNLTSAEALYSTIIKSGASTTHIDGTLNETLANTWSTAGTNTFTKSTIGYDQDSSTREFDGKLKEIILYTSDQSANRSDIEDNINSHYSIYP